MAKVTLERFVCQIDHLAFHQNALFGFGWTLDPNCLIASAELRLKFSSGNEQSVRVSLNRPREDVANAFPGVRHAISSGFVMMAGWHAGHPISATLHFRLESGAPHTVSLTLPASDQQESSPSRIRTAYLIRRAWAYLRQGNIRLLLGKLGNYRKAGGFALVSANTNTMGDALKSMPCRLIIDHSMGGGANLFRDAQVGDWVACGEQAVILTFNLSTMLYNVEIKGNGKSERFVLTNIQQLLGAFDHANLIEVFINCFVSFPAPDLLRQFIANLLQRTRAKLTIAIHEYYSICPSHFLLDNSGQFCGIPTPSVCASCLSSHQDGFVSLTGERSISQWRANWRKFLESANEIRCFSRSSIELLDRAYPGIGARANLSPHLVIPLRRLDIAKLRRQKVRLGIVGAISEHKGAKVLEELALAIRRTQANVQIIIIGTMEGQKLPDVITEAGPYKTEQLSDLIEQHGINMALMPSICPETFSFVTHELLSVGIPIICFDLGAQAEQIRSYHLGRVTSAMDGDGLLQEIISFNRCLIDKSGTDQN